MEVADSESKIRVDSRVDRGGDNWSDNPKALSNKGGELGDNLYLNLEKTKINFSSNCDNSFSVTSPEEENKNLQETSATKIKTKEVEPKNSSNKPSQVINPVTSQSQPQFFAVNSVVPQAVTEVVTTIVDWKTYPYNSSDRYTLENRANKVKERILNCSTHNDLIKLLANNQASEPEIEWLVQNYLSSTERKQLEIVYKSTQGNLFHQTAEIEGWCHMVQPVAETTFPYAFQPLNSSD